MSIAGNAKNLNMARAITSFYVWVGGLEIFLSNRF